MKLILTKNDVKDCSFIVPKSNVLFEITELIENLLEEGCFCSQNILNLTKSFVDKQKLLLYLKEREWKLDDKNALYFEYQQREKGYAKIYLS